MKSEFGKEAKEVITKLNLPLTLLGCGGITEVNHFKEFFDSGADVALSGTGFIFNSKLALDFKLI